MRTLSPLLIPLTLSAWLVIPRLAEACSVCFGNPDSEHTQGMKFAILSLLAVTGGVLGSLATFFVVLARRSKLLAGEDSGPMESKADRELL
jgi:hypothetical protein